MTYADGQEVVAPKMFIVPTMENLTNPGLISGMVFISGAQLMCVSGASLAKIMVQPLP